MRFALTLAATLATAALHGTAAAGTYGFTVIDAPNALTTALYALNNDGKVVGAERDLVTHLHHALVGTRDGVGLLDPSGPVGTATESWAFSVNGHGDIAGMVADASGAHHGYLHHADGRYEPIDFPGATSTEAYGVNDRQDVIGVYTAADGSEHAFTRRHGHYATADLAGGLATIPLSINDAGTIVGEFVQTPDTIGYGFIEHKDGRFQLASDPDAPPESTYYISINNRHQVVGVYADSDGNAHNFVRKGGADVPFDVPQAWGATLVSAQTINDFGDIVGYYVDGNNGVHGYFAAARAGRPEAAR